MASVSLDPCQASAVSIGLINIGIFAVYFFVEVVDGKQMISNVLYNDIEFRTIMTFFVCLQLMMVFFYVLKFRHHPQITCTYWTGMTGILIALVGWFVLITNFDNVIHAIGAGFFLAGTVIYWTILFELGKIEDESMVTIYTIASWIVGISCLAFGATYAFMWILGNGDSWLYESLSFALLSFVFILFFLRHTPFPYRKETRGKPSVIYEPLLGT